MIDTGMSKSSFVPLQCEPYWKFCNKHQQQFADLNIHRLQQTTTWSVRVLLVPEYNLSCMYVFQFFFFKQKQYLLPVCPANVCVLLGHRVTRCAVSSACKLRRAGCISWPQCVMQSCQSSFSVVVFFRVRHLMKPYRKGR